MKLYILQYSSSFSSESESGPSFLLSSETTVNNFHVCAFAFWMSQKREELTVQQEALSHKREVLMADGEGPEAEDRLLQEINEEIEVLNANIDYINDSLSECQATIVQIEETKVQTLAQTHICLFVAVRTLT